MNISENPSRTVILHRVRNRVIETLEGAASYFIQREYERNVPIANVPSEILQGWDDWVYPYDFGQYTEPVYSFAEQSAMRQFHAVRNDVCKYLPNPLPPLGELIGTEPWERLRQAAETALEVFMVRGKFDEQREVFPRVAPTDVGS